MSNESPPPPTNLITQVSREQTQQPTSAPPLTSQRSFLKRICCCFCRDNENDQNQNSSDVQLDERQTQTVQTPPTPDSQPTEALLPPLKPEFKGKKTLVLDLDETLVHSSFKPIPNPDFIVPVEIDDVVHKVYVLKRPSVDEFMRQVGNLFEVVVFTASLSKYADPVLDLLDVHKVVQYRLFRESCSTYKGNYVKDLSRLGRDLNSSLIIDNSPSSYMFSQENAIPIETWFDDPADNELMDLIPILEQLAKTDNVRTWLAASRKKHHKLQLTNW
jgi:Dullard-like phosphatase family protein